MYINMKENFLEIKHFQFIKKVFSFIVPFLLSFSYSSIDSTMLYICSIQFKFTK